MIKNLQPDNIVITETINVCDPYLLINIIQTRTYYEFSEYIGRPILAYRNINDEEDDIQYIKLSEPFNSYAEAKAARLQFIHDYCEPQKENFEL